MKLRNFEQKNLRSSREKRSSKELLYEVRSFSWHIYTRHSSFKENRMFRETDENIDPPLQTSFPIN